MSYFTGIDIGSTASKVVVLGEAGMEDHFVLPTGWSSKETAREIAARLAANGYPVEHSLRVVATGYGRVAVDYAHKTVTEITCHGRGGFHLLGRSCTIVDIGGQDTKVISVENGMPTSFLMNDKCSAGTGKFLEIMANRLGVDLPELFTLAEAGTPLAISSMCTVFAESEVISHIGAGERREDIAAGVVDSVVGKVAGLCARHTITGEVLLTGGLCDSPYLVDRLAQTLRQPVHTHPLGRYAGALGAALIAKGTKK
ncbi:CoA activase [Pseudoflavonifractor phocaeensis]|uniref:acyl-CoA dehydratase activase n=1 Tax=Pseudoflavonifractor phocaeensis TaxID=1870988 RepID=UPI00195DAE58|nr:acyl-CoA dehydratase activase [Pseudoflavonifractor phocaeensis]MBM6869535.1 CoA activase [Pseudoflavonifractor phocaeensis]MBM6937471.1 CoA activase [Pseudoflavonifractor phocaeensis]